MRYTRGSLHVDCLPDRVLLFHQRTECGLYFDDIVTQLNTQIKATLSSNPVCDRGESWGLFLQSITRDFLAWACGPSEGLGMTLQVPAAAPFHAILHSVFSNISQGTF